MCCDSVGWNTSTEQFCGKTWHSYLWLLGRQGVFQVSRPSMILCTYKLILLPLLFFCNTSYELEAHYACQAFFSKAFVLRLLQCIHNANKKTIWLACPYFLLLLHILLSPKLASYAAIVHISRARISPPIQLVLLLTIPNSFQSVQPYYCRLQIDPLLHPPHSTEYRLLLSVLGQVEHSRRPNWLHFIMNHDNMCCLP